MAQRKEAIMIKLIKKHALNLYAKRWLILVVLISIGSIYGFGYINGWNNHSTKSLKENVNKGIKNAEILQYRPSDDELINILRSNKF